MSEARAGTGPEGIPDWQDDRTVVAVAMTQAAVERPMIDAPGYAAVAIRSREVVR
jgi:hypothetical protein